MTTDTISSAEDLLETIDENIYIVWDMNADSWSGTRTLVSIHKTLDGASASIPDRLKTEAYNRTGLGPQRDGWGYIRNYTYLAIEERKLLP